MPVRSPKTGLVSSEDLGKVGDFNHLMLCVGQRIAKKLPSIDFGIEPEVDLVSKLDRGILEKLTDLDHKVFPRDWWYSKSYYNEKLTEGKDASLVTVKIGGYNAAFCMRRMYEPNFDRNRFNKRLERRIAEEVGSDGIYFADETAVTGIYRGIGIGSSLMDLTFSLAERLDYDNLILFCDDGMVGYYKNKHGFEKFDDLNPDNGIVMLKKITESVAESAEKRLKRYDSGSTKSI